MAFLYSLFLILLPILLACVVILGIVLYRWRRHPSFAPVFNFKQPFWLALFISLGMIALGFAGAELALALKLDPKGLSCIPFLLFMLLGAFCCEVSSAFCIWRLLAAILSYVHSRQPK
jgi:hypothetical protein